ncbi:MAG TPA: metallophosphoesterase [Pirellulales bacterium]
MSKMLLAFNVSMLLVDFVAIIVMARTTRLSRRAGTLAAVAFAALLLSAASREGPFGQIRLLAAAVFVHGVILATALAAISWRSRRRLAIAWLLLAVSLLAVGVDSFYVEPFWLDVTRLTLHSPKIDRPIRIAVVADFQTDTIGDFEREVLERVLAEEPDIILFVGDYIQVKSIHRPPLANEFRKLLVESGIASRADVYAVKGNNDPPDWKELFRDSQARLFEETESIICGSLVITGLSQPDSRDPFLNVPPAEGFHIVFGHHPDYALGKVSADLMVAGHTHGGQVRLPIIGPLVTLSRIPRQWAAGVTDCGQGRTLVVSRGTGLERGNAPRLRFLCRPELVVIQLEPEA